MLKTYWAIERLIISLLTVMLLNVGTRAADAPPSAPVTKVAAATPANSPRPRVKISRETTYITAPLRPDGYPDYLEALNQLESQGVTPDNNAVVVIWQAMGPSKIPPKLREEYFKRLGIKPLPETGDYFQSQEQYRKTHEPPGDIDAAKAMELVVQAEKNESSAATRPWSAKEFPDLAAWLAANDKHIDQFVAASKRTRSYGPVLSETVLIIFAPDDYHIFGLREAARALVIRAMFRLQLGQVEAAFQDSLACHRLGHISGESCLLIPLAVGYTIDGMASQIDQTILQRPSIKRELLLGMRAEVARLGELGHASSAIDKGERFSCLGCICDIARKGPFSSAFLSGSRPHDDAWSQLMNFGLGQLIDWNRILRECNQRYDQMVEICNKGTRQERLIGDNELDNDLRNRVRNAYDPLAQLSNFYCDPGNAVTTLARNKIFAMFMESLLSVRGYEDQALMRRQLFDLAFALALYKADRGAFPEKLAELSPQYIKVVPKDLFNEAELHYTKKGGGYLLYSVGRNGNDDGAVGYDDPQAEHSDDLFVYIPDPAAQKK